MVDWSEIERLQADLQKTQESASSQRLSERNCVEILMKLEEMKLIDMFHSIDGKEYLTPNQLLHEIQLEVHAHGGRVNLLDLQSYLNVDLSIIDAKCKELVVINKAIKLVIGQLVSDEYLDLLADEINDQLRISGHVSIPKLSQAYDLPRDFLDKAINERMGRIIKGKIDNQTRDSIFTDSFIAKHKCRIRGFLSATTRPLPLRSLCNDEDITNHLVSMIVQELVREGRIKGQLSTESLGKTVITPQIYTLAQIDWIETFFNQNNYIEYSAAVQFGGSDSESYLRKRLAQHNPVFLDTLCAGSILVDQVASYIEDTLTDSQWCDVTMMLPSCFNDDDTRLLLEHIISQTLNDGIIFCDAIVTRRQFIVTCQSYFDTFINQKAEKEASKTVIVDASADQRKELLGMTEMPRDLDKKEQRRRRAHEGSGSVKRSTDYGGSGQGGREVKSKGTDKKKMRWQKEQEQSRKKKSQKIVQQDEDAIGIADIHLVLHERLSDCDDSFIEEIAEKLLGPLNAKYQESIKCVFLKQQRDDTKKTDVKSRKQLEEEVNNMWSMLQILALSFTYFDGNTLLSLHKHLLQSICTDLADLLFLILSVEFLPGVNVERPLTDKSRIALVVRFPSEMRASMTRLNKVLGGKQYEAFIEAFHEAVSPTVCDVRVKKLDKKKERQVLYSHKMSLLNQLEGETDPALCFHLCISIVFQTVTGAALNIPGKLIPSSVELLQEHVEREIFIELLSFQQRIIMLSTLEAAEREEAERSLATDVTRIKELAGTVKKKTAKKD